MEMNLTDAKPTMMFRWRKREGRMHLQQLWQESHYVLVSKEDYRSDQPMYVMRSEPPESEWRDVPGAEEGFAL